MELPQSVFWIKEEEGLREQKSKDETERPVRHIYVYISMNNLHTYALFTPLAHVSH